jgi:NitT/TauT family transport system ATP-binding protein
MIKLESVTFEYSEGPPVFKDFNWHVKRGESWAVLGPSGCGKTTLLYILAGLLIPTAGNVKIDQHLLTRPRPQTGLILQEYGLLPWATVKQNAELGLKIRGFYGPDGKHAPTELNITGDVDQWLERLGLSVHAEKFPGQISGGQRQRTAIARTLALHPDLLLMDEPFSSLDAPTRENLQNLTLELAEEQNLTMVIVTHAIEEAAILGKQILLLTDPPNTKTIIINNAQSGAKDYRNTNEYYQLCRVLRNRMDDQ